MGKSNIYCLFVISFLVEQLFNKRLICTQCNINLSHDDKMCNNCSSVDNKATATIFDVNQPLVFARMLDRLLPDIECYRKQIDIDQSSHKNQRNNTNDMMFNKTYQELNNRFSSSPFISLLLHLDGISLTKSNRLVLWVLSCSLIELPAHLRYRRFNMIILSVWVGYREPPIDLWLTECL